MKIFGLVDLLYCLIYFLALPYLIAGLLGLIIGSGLLISVGLFLNPLYILKEDSVTVFSLYPFKKKIIVPIKEIKRITFELNYKTTKINFFLADERDFVRTETIATKRTIRMLFNYFSSLGFTPESLGKYASKV